MPRKRTQKILRFEGGVNTKLNPRDLAENELADATNIGLYNPGYIETSGNIRAHLNADDNAIQAPPAVFNIPMNGTGDYMQWYAYNLTGEAPELNFDYSSLSVTRIAGLKTTSRP